MQNYVLKPWLRQTRFTRLTFGSIKLRSNLIETFELNIKSKILYLSSNGELASLDMPSFAFIIF